MKNGAIVVYACASGVVFFSSLAGLNCGSGIREDARETPSQPEKGAAEAGADPAVDMDGGGPDAATEPGTPRFETKPADWSVPVYGDGIYAPSKLGLDGCWSTLDVDGDQKPDLVVTCDSTKFQTPFGTEEAPLWKVYKNTGTGFDSKAVDWAVPVHPSGLYATNENSGSDVWTTMDIDGDGKVDVVVTSDPHGFYEPFGTSTAPLWKVYKNTGTGFDRNAIDWSIPVYQDGINATSESTSLGRHWTTMDIDGDAKPEIVITGDPDTGGKVYGTTAAPVWKIFRNTGTGFDRTGVDWAVPVDPGTYGINDANVSSSSRQWSTTDIDGDGKPDLVMSSDPEHSNVPFGSDTAPSWKVYKNLGTGFDRSGVEWRVPVTPEGIDRTASMSSGRRWSTLDLDGDHKADLVVTTDPSGGDKPYGTDTSPIWRLYPNTGSGFDGTALVWKIPSQREAINATTSGDLTTSWATLDLDGDGRLDLVITEDPDLTKSKQPFGTESAPVWHFYRGTR